MALIVSQSHSLCCDNVFLSQYILLIEPNTQHMHQDQAQDAIAQMPQISRPDAFELTAIGQLSKHDVDEITHSPSTGLYWVS
jgi:hypothetical protein